MNDIELARPETSVFQIVTVETSVDRKLAVVGTFN